MSWPTWQTTAPPLPGVVPTASIRSAVMPNASNPGASMLQYSPEQWAQMQQHNWQQWAQWQQQYQQWHQQYGAEYQKSMNAFSGSTAVPPPPPNENKPPPPPPPDESMKVDQYNTLQSRPATGYSTVPPPTQQHLNQPPPTNYQSQGDWQNANSKRPLSQNNEYEDNKRPAMENQWNKKSQPVKAQTPWNTQPAPIAQTQAQKLLNLEELTEAEKKFDKEFAAWEAQFNKWKEQNANHPDKIQYLEYEKKWESWRNSLLERREQMRKKRLALQSTPPANSFKSTTVPPPQVFNKPPPIIQSQKDQLPDHMFSKPPPTQIKQSEQYGHDSSIQNDPSNNETGFLKSSSPVQGGIPGLDLVKDITDQGNVSDAPLESNDINPIDMKGPDLDAISKGINTILGDAKLLNMLSMVSQNQNTSAGVPVDNQPTSLDVAQPVQKNTAALPSLLNLPLRRPNLEKPDQTYDKYSEPYSHSSRLETVNNFDDQTRMSFSNGPNEQEFDYMSNSASNFSRADKTNNFHRFAGTDNKHNMFGGNPNNDYAFNRNNNFDGPDTQPKNFNMNGPGFNQSNQMNYHETQANTNFNKPYDQRHNDKYENHSQDSGNQMDDQWNEEDEYEKYHTMFNEAEHSQEMPSEKPLAMPVKENPPADDEPLFVPQTVIDYEHKSLKDPEPEVSLDLFRMFDYRHKPVNRIPYPQRPVWLSSSLRNIKQFDPLGTGRFNTNDRTSHFERDHARYPFDRNEHFDRRPNFDDRDLRSNDRYSRDRYSESRNNGKSHMDREFDYNKEKPRYDYSPKRFKPNTDVSRNGFSEDRAADNSQRFDGKVELEELSDDEWNDKSYSNNDGPSQDISVAGSSANPTNNQNTTLEDLINPPGRYNRPSRIVIILRGPPGSGKTYLAKLIKDREVENGGSAPRILSLDDYFMVEHEKEVIEDGKSVRIKEMTYEYEAEMEDSYRQSLVKSFKKTITDGYFHFVVVDNVNQKVKNFGEMWSFAKQNGFQVYICQLDLDPELCTRRNIHNRSESAIEDCIAGWEPTPAHHPQVDPTSFLQNVGPITEVEMEEADQLQVEKSDMDELEQVRSKWDTFDCSLNNLARLDGVSKPLRPSRTMEEYLQLDDEWEEPGKSKRPGQKRVRWADLEEQKQQKKMKALGFVVGQTDWRRIMDPTNGESALIKTKYIERN